MGTKRDRQEQRGRVAKQRAAEALAVKASALRAQYYGRAQEAYAVMHHLLGGKLSPNFFNKPEILSAEKVGLNVVGGVLWHVINSPQPEDRKSNVLTALRRIQEALVPEEIGNRCHDLHAVIALYLNRIGCPAVVVRGTLEASSPGTRGFIMSTALVADDPSYITGHSWIVTPFWRTIDLSLAHQFDIGEDHEILKAKIPHTILLDEFETTEPKREWWRLPGKHDYKISDNQFVEQTRYMDLLGWNQAVFDNLTVRYLPYDISLPIPSESADMNTMALKIGGMGPEDFFQQHLADLVPSGDASDTKAT